MSASKLEDFLILRKLDEPVTTDDLEARLSDSNRVIPLTESRNSLL